MNVVRPIAYKDLDSLIQFAKASGAGFTSLPDNVELLEEKIQCSCDALASHNDQVGSEQYLFVLEDSETGNILGTTGVVAAVGLESPWYHYRIGKVVHASRKLSIYNQFKTLYLCNDYTGYSEVCTLYLSPDNRRDNNGGLLSRSRFLFMAEHPQRFADKVIAEMRGYSDKEGRSPFWEGLGRRFFTIDFSTADYLTGSGNKAFIAELMPKHSMYIHLLPEESQSVIGQVHPETAPARRMLESEGFRFEDYVDIFDAGPTLTAPTQSIRAIAHSRNYQVEISEQQPSQDQTPMLIANNQLDTFRCSLIYHHPQQHIIHLTAEQADVMRLKQGDNARLVDLKAIV